MSQVLKERLKNLIIFILIITGILQVGILYGYQSQGTPTNLFMGLFNRSSQISDDVAKEKLFTPDKLILSDGNASYWVIYKNNEFYNILLEEAKAELKSIAMGGVSLKVSDEEWGDLTEKKGIIINIGYKINPELLKWLLGVEVSGKDLPDILKLMIRPDIVEENSALVYIYSSDGKVYVSDTVALSKAINLTKIFATVSDNPEFRLYSTFRSANIDKTQDAPPDTLLVIESPKYWPYLNYNCKIPDKAENNDELTRVILGNEVDRYNKSQDNEGTLQFVYSNNIYRFYSDGSLTYRYTDTSSSTGKGSMGGALLNAYKFVDRVNRLSDSAADIMLTGIEEIRTGVYKISFDYDLNGMQVRLDPTLQAGNGDKLPHAVNIQADSKRVLQCTWLMRDFAQTGKGNYNDRFMDLMPSIGRGYDEMKINDVHTGYYIKSIEESTLNPTMLIDMKDKPTVQIEMPSEKGD